MRGKLGDNVRLKHVMEAISEIESYVLNADLHSFNENSMMRFACLKQLEIIGEACNHLSNELKHEYTAIDWSQIIAMRNVFVHEYFGIDSQIVWNIIQIDIPELKKNISSIIF